MPCHVFENLFQRSLFKDVYMAKKSQKKKRYRKGLLWIYGDCYAYHFYQQIWNTSLCTQQFQQCKK